MPDRRAQERAERIRAFREEAEVLAREGVLELSPEERTRLHAYHDDVLRDLAARFDVDLSAEEKQLSWGMRIASSLAALALGAAVFFLFFRFWGLLPTPAQLFVLVSAPLLGLAGLAVISGRERTGTFTSLLGIVAFACFVLNLVVLATIFNLASTQHSFLAWAGFGLLLAYAHGARLLQAAGILSLLAWIAATTGTIAGCCWFDLFEKPENFVAAGLVLFLVPVVARHREGSGFPALYRVLGLSPAFLAILVLSSWGQASYLRLDPDAVEILYQSVGFLLAGLTIWIGVRCDWRDTANLGVAFFVVHLYTKFFDWWWELMPKYVFFLLLGAVGVVLLFCLRWFRTARKAAAP